jgi:hypothetical protein
MKSKLYHISLPDGSGEYVYISEDETEVRQQMDEDESIDGIFELDPITKSSLPENIRLQA